ncbi:MAG TPA: calcium/proton exchanger [Tepidisphaeraceae bacterium]|jgi:Ca2+:H+ antiporter|nr:calcium/proton exchanger [Tepidisphaeraceae bacterium]
MRFFQFAAYACIPLAFAAHLSGLRQWQWEPILTFVLAGIGIVPLAWLIGEATAQLAGRAGPMWGGLLNATFGNVTELIIGVIALSQGLNEFVKASLIGSILGNVLLVAGGAMVVGGLRRERQIFSRAAIEAYAGLLFVGLAGMLAPAIFHFSYRLSDPALALHENRVSVGTSAILIAVYVLAMVFTLKTHAHLLAPPRKPVEQPPSAVGGPGILPDKARPRAAVSHAEWSRGKAILVLLFASAAVAVVSELLVGSADLMSQRLSWNRTFVGAMLLALIGNAAEHSSAIMLARRDDMNTAMAIVYQSSLQIALFVTPVLVLVSWAMAAAGIGHGHITRLDLVFSALEVAAVILAVGIATVLGLNGESNWFEGALLIAVWAIFAVTFFCIPDSRQTGYDGQKPAAGVATRLSSPKSDPGLSASATPAAKMTRQVGESEAMGYAVVGHRTHSP